MEQKNLKTQVYVSDAVFNESAEQPIDVDFTLPDYCPEIAKILKCRAVVRISSKGINGRNVTADGTAVITVIYADNENQLCSYEYQFPFAKTFEAGSDCDGCDLLCRAKCEYLNCRAVTSRKIDIHGAAGLFVKVMKRKSTDIISDFDDPNIELRRGSAPATTPMGSAEKYLVMEEEIETGQGQPSVRSLIRYDAALCVRECKLLNEKAVVKGEMILTALYCPDSGAPQTIHATLPFSQLMELSGVNESCNCDAKAELAFLELKPRTAASGEIRSFSLNAKLLIRCDAYCDNDIAVLLDAYSRRYEADIAKSEVCFQKLNRTVSEVYHCKSELTFPDGALGNIADLWCEADPGTARVGEDGLQLNGTVTAFLIAYDSEGTPAYFEKPIDFAYHYSLPDASDRMHCEPQVTVITCGYTITGGGGLELRVDLGIQAAIYETNEMPLIVDLNVDETKPVRRKDRGAMTIYFATGGESVWDIARRYRASVDEIMQINEVKDDRLPDDKMILVPMN